MKRRNKTGTYGFRLRGINMDLREINGMKKYPFNPFQIIRWQLLLAIFA